MAYLTIDSEGEQRIRRLLDHLRNETTDQVDDVVAFEPDMYRDPEVARLERERIFARVPSVVAHSSELPEPNDFVTLQMPRNQVLIVRQEDGTVRGFVNQCRHRGAMLEQDASGQCRLFSCSYHRWSYNTDGSLRRVTRENTYGDFDKSQWGLVELPVEERHGFVWLVDNSEAEINVASWLGPEMDRILGEWEVDQFECFRVGQYDEPVNWKIMQDAFLDSYHIQYAHPNTAGKVIHTNVLVFEDHERHARFASPRKTIDRYLDEAPNEQESLRPHVIETLHLGPNCTLLGQKDHYELLTFRPDPVDPGQSRMEMRLIVPPVELTDMDEGAWTDLWEKNWKILQAVLYEEDFPIARGSQSALESADAGPMMLGRNEVVNQLFHRQVRWMLTTAGELY